MSAGHRHTEADLGRNGCALAEQGCCARSAFARLCDFASCIMIRFPRSVCRWLQAMPGPATAHTEQALASSPKVRANTSSFLRYNASHYASGFASHQASGHLHHSSLQFSSSNFRGPSLSPAVYHLATTSQPYVDPFSSSNQTSYGSLNRPASADL